MSEFSNYLEAKLDELVTANRILGRENVCDAFGHVSIRHPDRDDRYFLSRSRAPERIEVDDLMEFTLNGDPIDQKGRSPYAERFIPRRDLRKETRRALGGPQPQHECDSVWCYQDPNQTNTPYVCFHGM